MSNLAETGQVLSEIEQFLQNNRKKAYIGGGDLTSGEIYQILSPQTNADNARKKLKEQRLKDLQVLGYLLLKKYLNQFEAEEVVQAPDSVQRLIWLMGLESLFFPEKVMQDAKDLKKHDKPQGETVILGGRTFHSNPESPPWTQNVGVLARPDLGLRDRLDE